MRSSNLEKNAAATTIRWALKQNPDSVVPPPRPIFRNSKCFTISRKRRRLAMEKRSSQAIPISSGSAGFREFPSSRLPRPSVGSGCDRLACRKLMTLLLPRNHVGEWRCLAPDIVSRFSVSADRPSAASRRSARRRSGGGQPSARVPRTAGSSTGSARRGGRDHRPGCAFRRGRF